MSTTSAIPAAAAPALPLSTRLSARLSDYLELSKPRIVVLELIVASAAALIAAPHSFQFNVLLAALAGTALVAASASAANHLLERNTDAAMPRTANRPLAAGRITAAEAIVLSSIGLVAGMTLLLLAVNRLTALLGLASWVLYVVIYTPMKRRTPQNTTVGAVAGALPLLMGWTATGVPLDLTALSLASVLFLWQFPHFMAIAWLYRDDYAAGGHKMLTVVDPSGLRAGVLAVVAAALLIPVSLVPALPPTSGSPWIYAVWATGLGTVQLLLAVRFAIRRDHPSAKRLLRATLVFLPAWMAVLAMVRV
ncbi:MAG: heme o synthase [Planctomycetota bacterium]